MDEPVSPSHTSLVRRGIGRRLAFWTGGAGALLAAVVVALVVPTEQRAVARIAAERLSFFAEAVAATYRIPVAASDAQTPAFTLGESPHATSRVVTELGRARGLRFIDVVGPEGRVAASSAAERIGGRGDDEAFDRGDDALVVTAAIIAGTSCMQCHDAHAATLGTVRVGANRETVLASLEHFHAMAGVALFGVFAVLVGLILVVTDRLVARPVFGLARVMKRAEEGDFLVRAPVHTADEVGELGMAFNRMLRAITSMKATEIERDAALHRAEAELSMKGQLEEAAAKLRDSNQALERRVRAQELLMEAAHRLGSTLDRDALLERLTRLVNEKLGRPDFAAFVIVDGSPEERDAILQVAASSGHLASPDFQSAALRVGEGFTGLVAETGAPIHVDDLSTAPLPAPGSVREPLLETGSLLSVPMLHKGRVVGVLDFYAPEPGAFDDDDVALLQALGAQAAMAVVNADLYQTTLELSVKDSLTGLMNRRALQRVLDAELTRAQRFSTPLAVLMLDVDHFKQYNDRMGHLLGDEALKAVAAALESSVRKVDAVARFGGEEFCVVLPRTDEAAGLDVAEKLLRAVRALDLPGADKQPLGRMSISVGVALYPEDMPAAAEQSPVDLVIDVADKAAYAAKHRGRDRVLSASEVHGRPKRPKLNEPNIVSSAPGAAPSTPALAVLPPSVPGTGHST